MLAANGEESKLFKFLLREASGLELLPRDFSVTPNEVDSEEQGTL